MVDFCILFWMVGGMVVFDNFDLKCYVFFEVGMLVEKIISMFLVIDMVIDDIKICVGLENIV